MTIESTQLLNVTLIVSYMQDYQVKKYHLWELAKYIFAYMHIYPNKKMNVADFII